MRVFICVGVAVAQLLRTTPTSSGKHLTHGEKIENLARDLAAHAGNCTNGTVLKQNAYCGAEYSLQTLDKVEQEVLSAKRAKSKADPLTDEMFNPVIDQIRGILRGNVKESIDGLAAAAVASVKKIEKCADDLGFQATADSSGYNAAKQELDDGGDAAEEECESVTTGIEARDNAGKQLYENVVNSVGCSQTADVADVPMDALNFPLKNINLWAQTVITEHKEWFEAAQKVTTTTGDCSESQFDSAKACAKVEHLAGQAKQAYETCYDTAKGQYDGSIAALISASQATVRPQIEMVESLICYIRIAIREWDNPQSECVTTSDGKLVCRCDADQGEVYSGIEYDFRLHLGPYELNAPDKDMSWDGKGCSQAEEDETCTPSVDPCDSLRACLVAKCWRKEAELGSMSDDDMRNTVIVELNKKGLASVGELQGMTNELLVHASSSPHSLEEALLSNGWRSEADLKTMSKDDMRNTVIVELNKKGLASVSQLQGMSNAQLVAKCGPAAPTPKGGPYFMVPSDSIPAGYRAVSIDELNGAAAAFIKQYNEQGIDVPSKFVSNNCCVRVASGRYLHVSSTVYGYVYPALNGEQLCNPSGGYEAAVNYKFYGSDTLPQSTTFSEVDNCSVANNPMLVVQE